MNNKKGQALSLNTVIIAAIVVLVLIVLSFIVIHYLGEPEDETTPYYREADMGVEVERDLEYMDCVKFEREFFGVIYGRLIDREMSGLSGNVYTVRSSIRDFDKVFERDLTLLQPWNCEARE